MSTAGAQPTKLPAGIEIFAAGTRTADDGRTWTITEADLQASVAAYDPALHEAPLTIGHPEGDKPAYGWVGKLAVQPGGRLVMDAKDEEPQFAEMVNTRRFPKRSTAFYTPDHPQNPKPGVWYVRHVAFLGAQPPAVKGLRDPQFAEKDAGAGLVFFSEVTTTNQEHTMTPEEIAALKKKADDADAARLKAEKDAADEKTRADAAQSQLTQFAEQQRQQTHASHVAFAESMASEAQGCKILPKDKGALVATLDALATLQPVEFSEGNATHKVTPVEFVKNLVTGAGAKVQFGEHAPGNAGGGRLTKDSSDADIDKAAKAYAADKKVSYAEGLRAVTATFTSAA